MGEMPVSVNGIGHESYSAETVKQGTHGQTASAKVIPNISNQSSSYKP